MSLARAVLGAAVVTPGCSRCRDRAAPAVRVALAAPSAVSAAKAVRAVAVA